MTRQCERKRQNKVRKECLAYGQSSMDFVPVTDWYMWESPFRFILSASLFLNQEQLHRFWNRTARPLNRRVLALFKFQTGVIREKRCQNFRFLWIGRRETRQDSWGWQGVKNHSLIYWLTDCYENLPERYEQRTTSPSVKGIIMIVFFFSVPKWRQLSPTVFCVGVFPSPANHIAMMPEMSLQGSTQPESLAF